MKNNLHTFKAGNTMPSTRVVHADVAEDLLAALEMASRIIAKGGSITGSQIEIIDSALAKAKGEE